MSIEIAGNAGPARPLASFIVVTYNQEAFIADALAGAFAQTYTPLQIILSDDCSTDATFSIMEEAVRHYRGPHRIILNRNEHNLGIGLHINQVVELAEGEWLIGSAGDDVSLPERTEKIMAAAMQSGGKARSIWSRAQHMRANGTLLDRFEQSSGAPYSPKQMVDNQRVVMGCSHAWHHEVFEVFGPLYHTAMFEDNAISFRSFLLGDIVYIDDTLVRYRQHDANVTNYLQTHDAAAQYVKMFRRRQLAIVGIHQRMLDVITYGLHNPGNRRQAMALHRALQKYLSVQSFKMDVIDRFRWIDTLTARIRSGMRRLSGRFADKAPD